MEFLAIDRSITGLIETSMKSTEINLNPKHDIITTHEEVLTKEEKKKNPKSKTNENGSQ